MASPTLIHEPIAEESWLSEQRQLVTRHWRLVSVVFVSVLAAVMLWSLLTRPVYQGHVRILIERENPRVLSFKEVAEVDSARDDYFQTQYKLLQSRALVRKVLEDINLFKEQEFGGPHSDAEVRAARASAPGQSALMDETIDRVLRRLSVVPEKYTRLVSVKFESYTPDVAAQVANSLARLYIAQTLEFRYETSAEAGKWLAGQIQDQRAKVEQLEAAQQRLKEHQGITNIEERRSLLAQKLKELGSAATTLKTMRLEKEAVHRQMKSTSSPEELPDVIRNPVVQALRIELGTLGRKEAQLAEKYLDQHPELVQVRKQIEDTGARLMAEAQRVVQAAENEFRTAQAQEASVLSALETVKAEADDLARRSVQYDTRKRELDAANAVLGSVLSRAKETDVSQELRASNIRIVDPATVPRRPIRPNRSQDFVLSLVLGLGVSLGFVLLFDHLDASIKTVDDVRRVVATPLLAVIPEAEKTLSGNLLLGRNADRPSDFFFEGYRVLRTALQYCWSDPGSRVVLVTSTLPGEGKTLTSVNLARSLAAMQARVLLVDCDLRKPQIHTLLERPRTPGLSDVLVGKVELEDAIYNDPGTTFDVLFAGAPVPSPADILTGASVKVLVEGFRARYDWILFDTAPVGAVADPLILAPHTDGALVVICAELVHRSAARETVRRLMGARVRVLGALLNRTRREQHSYYYHSYYRGRGYGAPEPDEARETTLTR